MPEIKDNDFTAMLMNLYDVRRALPAKVKSAQVDNEDADFTIGDLLDGVIETLEAYDNQGESK